MNSKLYEIKCPKCESVWMVKCESIVHAENEKSLKKIIIEEAFFTRKCSKCGELITFYYPFLYCDLKRKFLIALVVDEDINWINDLEKLDIYKSFHKHIVHNNKELKEKILIYEYGLDVYGIQLLKNQLQNKYKKIYFEQLVDSLLWFESENGPIGVESKYYSNTNIKKDKFLD